MRVLGYVAFRKDNKWLHYNEKTWTNDFSEAANYTDAKLAQDIADREKGNEVAWVMAVLDRI